MRSRSRFSTITTTFRPRISAKTGASRNLFEIWLEGDHYKWRAMRANGVDERFCTGDAPPYEKFLAWARTVPYTLRNPLYHWTHLELQRYFGIDELLDENAPRGPSGSKANEKLAGGRFNRPGHFAAISHYGAVHYRRPGRRSSASPGHRGVGILRGRVSGVPAGPGL